MRYGVFNKFPQINTKRLVLREIKKEDAESIYKLRSNPKVARYETFKPYTNIKQAERTIECFSKDFKNKRAIAWGISLKSQSQIIGIIRCEIEIPKVRADFGYDLRYEYWNKGIMTEAVSSIIDFTFNKIDVNRIESAVSTKNIASARVLEKSGFTKEGILRERSLLGGTLHDMIMFSILKKEYIK